MHLTHLRLLAAPIVRGLNELTAADFDAEWPGLTANCVEGFLGRDFMPGLYRVEHDMMDYGVHWRWAHGQQFYTAAGLLLIVDELRKEGQAGPALQLAAYARQSSALFRARRQCEESKAAAMIARITGDAA